METSSPDIFAVGECVEHRGVCYGLVAPLFEQGKVLAATITGNKGPTYTGTVQAAKLKIMGVDVFSAGDWSEQNAEPVRYEDRALGVYKKLTVRDGKLAGVILVGDTSRQPPLHGLAADAAPTSPASGGTCCFRRRPPTPASTSPRWPDSATVCGCVGVTKGAIIQAIHERGVNTLSQLKECTRASTGCGSCTGLCQDLLRAVAPEFEEEAKKVICGCVPFAEDHLREILRSQRLQVGAGGARHLRQRQGLRGLQAGAQLHARHALVRRSRRGSLGALHQRPRARQHPEGRHVLGHPAHPRRRDQRRTSCAGSPTSPTSTSVPMVKITGSQRIDLLGVKKEDLPKVWADLGMPSGQAYTKGVRMVKTCVGTEFCRFGTQDSTSAGIELERRFEQLFTPHKVKMAAVGCPRNCAEATVKDIGLVGQEGGWQVVVGGAAGKSVRKADLLTTVETHRGGARSGGALLPVLPRERQLPGAHLRLRRAARHREGAEGHRLRAGAGAAGAARSLRASRRRARSMPGSKGGSRARDAVRPDPGAREGARMNGQRWMRVTACENIPLREGRAVTLGGREIAIFNLGDRFLATDNRCPHQAARSATASSPASPSCVRCTPGRCRLDTGAVERPAAPDKCVATYPDARRRRNRA